MLFIFIIFFLSIKNVQAQCFSFIPYAHNSLYSHLPKNKNFCVKNKFNKFNYKTSKNSARLISNNNEMDNYIFAFGDSQMLGIDWDENKKINHHLETILSTNKISIFASPNNGPFQALSQAKKVFKLTKMKNVSRLIFSFNFSTDIFRIQKKWRLENFVPITSNDLDKIILNPFIYDLILLKGVLSGKFFSTNLPNNEQIINQYKSLSKYEVNKRINIWIHLITKFHLHSKKRFELIVYPPYWIYNDEGKIINDLIFQDFINLIETIKSHNIFFKIYVGKINEKISLTKDNRHFSNGSLKFTIYK